MTIAHTLLPSDPRHGSLHGYNSFQCRCNACRQAMRDYRAKARTRLTPDDARHGLASTYTNLACRCLACTTAEARRNAASYAARRGNA